MASKEMNDLSGGITDADIQAGGVGKKGPVVGVHLINVKGLKLIERDKAESQAMMVMSDDN
eukprot:CAMPEP_0171987054 /NCGR_PEP_ID=MMETSP0993-20121228/275192_1 /TAXON_ID=483369 /ORGANISM="non described non described, Strain CCMP2098" /LENGTH=60 /DNA_ID=CAMNT_0012639985 /DNA_START=273 /DNA_END=456 /DNA_ORIENTATION=-